MNIIHSNFGSKRGLFNSVKYKLLFLLGKFQKNKHINFEDVEHLVFICSGNICRSSLAEYVAKSLNISSESFGLHCRGGDNADPRAIEFASRMKLDMLGHKTRNIKEYQAKHGDLIVVMEPSHIEQLEKLGFKKCQITSLPIWAINNVYLHDPFNTPLEFFDHCEKVVVAGVKRLQREIKNFIEV